MGAFESYMNLLGAAESFGPEAAESFGPEAAESFGPEAAESADEACTSKSEKMKEVEESLMKCTKTIQNELQRGALSDVMELIGEGIRFAKENDQHLTDKARFYYSGLYVLKANLLFNPFNPFDSMDQVDLAIWVSKSPKPSVVRFSVEWYSMFFGWCAEHFCKSSKAIVDFFEKKVRLLNKLADTDPVGSASSILMYSTQCCQLASFISSKDRSLIKKTMIVNLIVQHGFLSLKQNKVDTAKKDVERAFDLEGKSAQLYLLASLVGFHLLSSMSPSSFHFEKQCKDVVQYVSKGLALTADDESDVKQEFLVLKAEAENQIRRAGDKISQRIKFPEVSADSDEEELPEIARELLRQKELQAKKREAFLEKQAKVKTKERLVSRRRETSQSRPETKEGEEEEEKKEQKKKKGKKQSASKEDANQYYLMNTEDGVYKVDSRGFIKGTNIQPKQKQKPKLKQENHISREIYSFLIQNYTICLACDLCIIIPDGNENSFYKVSVKTGIHNCLENQLMLRKMSEKDKDAWVIIRPCPRRFKFGPNPALCDSFLLGEACMEKSQCPNPHSNEELDLWTKYFKTKISLQKFIDDLRESPLRAKFDTEHLCEVFDGAFRFICKSCYVESSRNSANDKKHHQPFCENEENPHAWIEDNQMLVFDRNGTEYGTSKIIPVDSSIDHIDCDCKDQTAVEVRRSVKNLREIGIEKVQIVEESKRYWQKREKGSYISTREKLYERCREDSISSGNGSSADLLQNSPDSDVEEDPDKVYDSDLDDVMTVHDSDEEDVDSCDEDDDGYEDCTNYYDLKTEDELRRLLREEPGKYKRCIIHLDGPYTAKCKVLDTQAADDNVDSGQSEDIKEPSDTRNPKHPDDRIIIYNRSDDMGKYGSKEIPIEGETVSDENRVFREIEIRGRANCGMSFSGDEVVVELKKTKELGDNAAEVYRGTVVGILKRHTNRRAYTFVCRVDSFVAHLMRPINGIAPKLHVMHSVIKNKYPNKKNELVAKYHMEDGEVKLDKIVKLDPKKRRDMLFVVKYLQWLPRCMYPLGYVTKIIQSGETLEDSQKVLNLLYQVPTKPNLKCSEAAKELLESGTGNANCKLLDMRNWLTLSIDPSDCKDVDDALTLRRTEVGFEVGVHIADVSEFVERDGVIDQNARKRVTSYYPATNTVYHMLPRELSENLCSLQEGEERLALSVFVNISFEGEFLSCPNIKRTIIKNDKKMTYEEAQAFIDAMPSSKPTFLDERDEKSVVLHLNYLAKKLRANRLKRGQYYFQEDNPFAVSKCHDAHRLVEEFMILTNIQVANFLVQKFPECTPIRRQLSPNAEDLKSWLKSKSELVDCSFYFNQFDRLSNQDYREDVKHNADTYLSILVSTLKLLKMASEKGDLEAVKTIVGSEMLHPDHALAMIEWWGLQEAAEFVPSGDLDDKNPDHFSLQVPFYVQFTSPIRRYMDIVIHRLVKCALEQKPSAYSLEEIRRLCDKVNDVSQIAKKYHKASKLLELTNLLMTPFYLPCFVEDFDDDTLTLTIPHLGKVAKSQRVLKYSALSVSDKPDVGNKVELLWEKRLYDAGPGSSLKNYARRRHNARRLIRIESNRYTAHVSASHWRYLMDAISGEDVLTARKYLKEIMDEVSQEKQCRTEIPEVTSEMYQDAVMVKHHVRFSQKLTRGSVMAVQFGAECTNGFLQPTIRMVNLTPEKDVCVEHRIDPVKCFAELATEKVLPSYNSIDQYKNIWLPILAMEAASKTVAAGETILCNNVRVSVCKRNDQYYGKLRLPLIFCKKRKIHIFNNSKDGEEDSNDFMCIRYHRRQEKAHDSSGTICTSFIRNIWVGHAVALYVHLSKSQDVVVKFRLQPSCLAPPAEFLNAGKTGEKCTVEFLTKLLPDRRMEDAVNSANESSDLCKKIILGQRVDDLPEITKYPQHDTYDVEVDPSSKIYKNNSSQTEAIRKSLQGKFTLIQGPPGTGKTVTGIKVAYWFVRMNKDLKDDGGSHGQVLYCGPSNSSVDVAAKWLKKLGKNCPKIIRLYSQALEKQVFPIPRDNLQIGTIGGRHYELIDKDENKDIALHHIIRQKGKKFSAKIRAFDKLFATNRDSPEEVSDEKVEEYQKLITDAAIHELKEYNILLCTCAASVSPRMLRSANIHQIITDECGMCMEPETLIPLQAFKSARQVVLIGDHKQLQPIVTNTVAKSLGLDISLFERYKDRAIMLTEQYRMHPRICEFPSKQFYDKKLTTAEKHDCIGEKWLKIWPNRYSPMVFCHAEGAEKILSVSTEDGNERSRSNELERKEAVRIFLNLVNLYYVDPDKITILSQYKAQCTEIEQDLKASGYEHPNVGTVIASQGDEWDYVILSLVRSMPQYEIEKKPSIGWCQKNMGFIIDEHQINVALTRARLGLIIIGNKHLLGCDKMWKDLLWHFESRRLVVNTEDFLPSANRRNQRPPSSENDGQSSSVRFENQAQGPRNNNRNFKQFGNRPFQNYGPVRNNPSSGRTLRTDDQNDTKRKKDFQKSATSNGCR